MDERGFALIAALWLMVALSVIGLEFGLTMRSRRLAVANAIEGAQGQGAADAGIETTYARLVQRANEAQGFQTTDPNRWLDPWAGADSVLRDTMVLGNERVVLTVRDAGAALNLNLAQEEDLRRFFSAFRMDYGEADRLSQAICDWRDADDFHRARGAERDDYIKEGARTLPANAPFSRLAELLEVRGMTPALYQRFRSDFTLLGTGRINLNAASRPVLLSLPGMSESAIDVLLHHRTVGRPIRSFTDLELELPSGPRATLEAGLPELQPRTVFETSELEVTSTGWTVGSPVRAVSHALFVRSGTATFLVSRRAE